VRDKIEDPTREEETNGEMDHDNVLRMLCEQDRLQIEQVCHNASLSGVPTTITL